MFQPHHDTNTTPLYGNILVIENDPVQQQVIHMLLRKLGLSTSIIFADVKTLRELDKKLFNAILVDAVLQFVDSVNLVRNLRESGYDDPIIVLTNDSISPDPFLEAGCNGYCLKPVDEHQLYATLRPFLACNSRLGRSCPMVSGLLESSSKDKEKVTDFINKLPLSLNRIRQHFKKENWSDLINQLREVNGAEFGFPALEHCCKLLENQIQNAELELARLTLSDLQIICQRIYLGNA